MRPYTHLTAGACAAMGLGYLAQTPIGLPELAAAMAASLLPNVDNLLFSLEESDSKTLRRLAQRWQIGGDSHGAPIMIPLALGLGLALALGTGRWGMLPAVLAGVASHLLLDVWGKIGIQLWAPFSRAWIAFPPKESLRPGRGGYVEAFLFLATAVVLGAVLTLRLYPLAGELIRLLQDLWRGAL